MQPEHISVGNLFSGEWTYTVPLFQRPYVWDVQRWEPLWEDVGRVAEEACRGASKVRPHFLGSVVLQQRQTKITEGPRREVIDGQQRLTTLQLLLKAVADVLDEGEDTAEAARPLRRLLRNEDAPAKDEAAKFKVWPTNIDRDRFVAVMTGAHPTDGGRLRECHTYFRKEAARWLKDGQEPAAQSARAHALSAALRQRLWLIALNLSGDDQAQVIFETLNARGTPLLPADLIKNLLLRRAEEEENADPKSLYETHWRVFDTDESYWRRLVGRGHTARPRVDLFLAQFLTVKTHGAVSPGQLYEHFSDWLSEPVAAGRTEQRMAEVSRHATVYRGLDESPDAGGDRLGVAAARLRAMDFASAVPVLLYLRADSGRSDEDIAQAAIWIESFLVRRLVVGGLSTRAYGTLFADLLGALAKLDGAAPVAPAVAEFLSRQVTENALWPDDAAFDQAFTTAPLYWTLRRDRLTMILRALDAALRGPRHDPVPLPKALHVEHVMPKNWRAHWADPAGAPIEAAERRDRLVQTIGNLTLLTAKLNQSLSDSDWDTKRPALQTYGLTALNADLATHERWDDETIRARSEKLARTALAIWPHGPSAASPPPL